jgi:hypothetical protein
MREITNTVCRLRDLTQEQIATLTISMPSSEYWDWLLSETMIGFDIDGDSGTWYFDPKFKIVTYTEMMGLLGATMKFTKSDLKTGMFVKYRNGDIRLVLGDTLTGDLWASLRAFNIDLSNHKDKDRDIMSVYVVTTKSTLSDYLAGNGLKCIWERTEQTPAQKEMEVLQSKMDDIQKQMEVVKAKL